MPLRKCFGCDNFYEKNGKPRCPRCTAQKDHERGSRRERGIGPEHERFAKALKDNPDAFCVCQGECCKHQGLCGSTTELTVGHKIPRSTFRDPLDADSWGMLQAECKRCNLAKGNR